MGDQPFDPCHDVLAQAMLAMLGCRPEIDRQERHAAQLGIVARQPPIEWRRTRHHTAAMDIDDRRPLRRALLLMPDHRHRGAIFALRFIIGRGDVGRVWKRGEDIAEHDFGVGAQREHIAGRRRFDARAAAGELGEGGGDFRVKLQHGIPLRIFAECYAMTGAWGQARLTTSCNVDRSTHCKAGGSVRKWKWGFSSHSRIFGMR